MSVNKWSLNLGEMLDNSTKNSDSSKSFRNESSSNGFQMLNLPDLPNLIGINVYSDDKIDDDDENSEFVDDPTKFNMKLDEALTKPLLNFKDNHLRTEGYCEFCRRNFCNKYYLKRHKLEVHGVQSGFNNSSDKNNWKRLKNKDKSSSTTSKSECRSNFLPVLDDNLLPKSSRDLNIDNSFAYFDRLKELNKSIGLNNKNSFHIDALNLTSNTNNNTNLNPNHNLSNPSINSNKTNLWPNLNETSNIKPNLPCPYCFQTFSRSHLVMHHMLVNHSEFMKDFLNFLSCNSQQKLWPINNLTNSPNSIFNNINHSSLLQFFYSQLINNNNNNNNNNTNENNNNNNNSNNNSNNGNVNGFTFSSNGSVNFSPNSGPINDRVKCDICLKDICNKYYLKLHKQRMHNPNAINENQSDSALMSEEFYNERNHINQVSNNTDRSTPESNNDFNHNSAVNYNTDNSSQKFCLDLCLKNFHDIQRSNFRNNNNNRTDLNANLMEKNPFPFSMIHGVNKWFLPKQESLEPVNDINKNANHHSINSQEHDESVVDIVSEANTSDNEYDLNTEQYLQQNQMKYLQSYDALDLSIKPQFTSSCHNMKRSKKIINPNLKLKLYRNQRLKQWNNITSMRQQKHPYQLFTVENHPINSCYSETLTENIFHRRFIKLPVSESFKENPFSIILKPLQS